MKVLLLGKTGQVGWELHRSLMPLGTVVAMDRTQCDLSLPETIPDVVRAVKPDVIVNTAAYTAVDKAEENEDLAIVVNGTAVGVLAEQAHKLNALLIHFSTDYVFDGSKAEPYKEDDVPNPVNAYGRSKLAGENAIIEVGCDYLILRTTWVYAARGNSFLRTMLRLANERKELRVVSDQYGAPTWARNIADVTAHTLTNSQCERKRGEYRSSICHLSASGSTTWHGFSSAIVKQARTFGAAGNIITEKVLPIATEDYPLPAARPKNSQLDSSSLTARFGLTMPDWQDALNLCMEDALESR